MSTAVTGPVLDPAKNPPSPKVIALGLVMLVVPALSSVLLYLNTEQGVDLYRALPVLVVVVLRSLLAGLSAWVTGYLVPDPRRVLDLATSPKVLAGVATGIVAQAVVDLVAFLSAPAGQTLYAAWPPIAVVALSAVLPAIAAAAAGYLVPDPARVTPGNPDPDPIRPVSHAELTTLPGALGTPPGVPGHPRVVTGDGSGTALPPVDGDPTVHRAT